MKPLLIYHFPCDDGFASALAFWLKYKIDIEYCGRDHSDPIETLPDVTGRDVFIVDFSFKPEVMKDISLKAKRLVWLDHHKTSFDITVGEGPLADDTVYKWKGKSPKSGDIEVILDNRKSGCILAWEYLFPDQPIPLMFKYIDDIDRWAKRYESSMFFSRYLRTKDFLFDEWYNLLLAETDPGRFKDILVTGETLQRAFEKHVSSIIKNKRENSLVLPPELEMGIAPTKYLVCNCPSIFASDVGALLAEESGTFGMTWSLKRNGKIGCQLRSKGDFDVSAIAKMYGGGGHKNAAGFEAHLHSGLI